MEAHMQYTHTHTNILRPSDFVQDYPGETVPEPTWILLKKDSEWQWHQLGHMQICISPQTGNHASIPLLSFFLQYIIPQYQHMFFYIMKSTDVMVLGLMIHNV